MQANASAGLFWAEVEGSFVTSKGYAGHFSTEVRGGFLGAKGLGASVGSGKSMSLATFSGPNFNVIGTLAIVSISDNFDPKTLDHVGQTDAISTPGLGIGATYSETRLRDVVCPTGF